MVQTLGISIGNANCIVAACKDGGIEILLNDYSQRSTPTMVAFNKNTRLIGVDASLNQNNNLKNTVYDILKLVGKSYKEALSLDLPFKLEEGSNEEVLIVVTHLEQEKRFCPVQLLAMILSKLKIIAGGTDCVLNCHQYYNEAQRAAVYKAAVIAGLNPLGLIPDMNAVALYYAYYRTNKTDEESNIVAFVNFGQSCLQTLIGYVCPKDDIIKILATDCEPEVGGRDFDILLADHFINTQQLQLTPRSKLVLIKECEKLKKTLSANSNTIPISIECLISEDKDFNAKIDRVSFEQLGQPIFEKIRNCLNRTQENAMKNLEAAGIAEYKVHAVEVVGGSSRIPAFKATVKEVFGMEASTRLDTDEAVARGCVLHCATLHPGIKVKRQVVIEEISPVNVDFRSLEIDKQMIDVEKSLHESDRQWKLRMDARNSLEEYIFDCRSKDILTDKLNEIEDWLYDEGDNCQKQEFITRLQDLKTLARPKMQTQETEGELKPVVEEPKQEVEEPKQVVEEPMPEAEEAMQATQEPAQTSNQPPLDCSSQ